LKKHSNSGEKSEPTTKRAKSRAQCSGIRRKCWQKLVGKLKEKLDPKKVAATSAGEEHPRAELRPNLDRLTVGVDLGDQWSHYCVLGLEGETLAEGQLRTTQEDIAEFFQALNAARVVFEWGHALHGCRKSSAVADTKCWWQPPVDGGVETSQTEE